MNNSLRVSDSRQDNLILLAIAAAVVVLHVVTNGR
jgi:hypothetical protein